MPLDRPAIVRAARSLLGTPCRHQGRLAGIALDCIGVPLLVARDLGYIDALPPADYRRMPDGHRLRQALLDHLDPAPLPPRPGDIALMTWRTMPMHVAVVGDGGEPYSLIHALAEAGAVVEHRADGRWRRRVIGAFAFRGVS